MVDPATVKTNDDKQIGHIRDRFCERQLEISLVFVDRVPLNEGTRTLGRCESGSGNRIEITDRLINRIAKRERVIDTRIGTDDEIWVEDD